MKQILLDHAEANILTRMVRDYLTEAPCLTGFYKYHFDVAEFDKVIEDKSKGTLHREVLVKVLVRQYTVAGLDGKPLDNIELLKNENTFTITTAHQPNIFTGYLFFVYKILSAINIAEQLKASHPQLNFVPVYWMGSEDHDFEEISSINLYGEKLQWQYPAGGPVGRMGTGGLEPLIDTIEQKLDGQPHAKELVALLRTAYLEHGTLADATRYLVHQLFGKFGLLIINQDDAELKQLFVPVLKDEVLNSRVSGMVESTINSINACNYKLQASPREINCFYLGKGKRERIVFDNATNQFSVLNTNVVFGREEIAADMDAHPQDYSPNVFLRPLYQETVLPNLAYIGGGGEVSYWLELSALFDYYKVNYPMLVLRSSLGVLDKNAAKKLEKLAVTPQDLCVEEETLVKEYVRRNSINALDLHLEKEQVAAIFSAVRSKASLVDVTLEKAVDGQQQAALNILDTLEGKILRAEKRNFETATTQLRALKNKLFPGGAPQERYENFIPYYAANGANWLDEIKPYCNPFDKAFGILVEE